MIEMRSTCIHTIVTHTMVCGMSDDRDPAKLDSGVRPNRYYFGYYKRRLIRQADRYGVDERSSS